MEKVFIYFSKEACVDRGRLNVRPRRQEVSLLLTGIRGIVRNEGVSRAEAGGWRLEAGAGLALSTLAPPRRSRQAGHEGSGCSKAGGVRAPSFPPLPPAGPQRPLGRSTPGHGAPGAPQGKARSPPPHAQLQAQVTLLLLGTVPGNLVPLGTRPLREPATSSLCPQSSTGCGHRSSRSSRGRSPRALAALGPWVLTCLGSPRCLSSTGAGGAGGGGQPGASSRDVGQVLRGTGRSVTPGPPALRPLPPCHSLTCRHSDSHFSRNTAVSSTVKTKKHFKVPAVTHSVQLG